MNPIGANTWIWTSPLTDEHVDLVGRVTELGFDVLELAIEDTARVSAELWRAAGDEAGVAFGVWARSAPTAISLTGIHASGASASTTS